MLTLSSSLQPISAHLPRLRLSILWPGLSEYWRTLYTRRSVGVLHPINQCVHQYKMKSTLYSIAVRSPVLGTFLACEALPGNSIRSTRSYKSRFAGTIIRCFSGTTFKSPTVIIGDMYRPCSPCVHMSTAAMLQVCYRIATRSPFSKTCSPPTAIDCWR